MKKWFFAILLVVASIITTWGLGPERALANSGYVCNVRSEHIDCVENIMDNYAHVLNKHEMGSGYTLIKQTIGLSPEDDEAYVWYVTAYDQDLHMIVEDHDYITFDNLDLINSYLAALAADC